MIILGYEKLEGMSVGKWELRNPEPTPLWGRPGLIVHVFENPYSKFGVITIRAERDGIISLEFTGAFRQPREILTPIGEIRTLMGVHKCITALLSGY